MDEARYNWLNPDKNHLFERITYHESAVEAIEGTDALYISTDWEEFRGLARTIQTTVQPPYLVIDGRRMLPDYDALVAAGDDYLPVGGQLLRANSHATSAHSESGHQHAVAEVERQTVA